MRHLILLMCVVAIAMTSCERPTYRETGHGSVYYKFLKKGDKRLVGLCFREKINGNWKETEELVRPQYDDISQDFTKGSTLGKGYFTFSRGDSSLVRDFVGNIQLDCAWIKKGSVEYLGTNLYKGACFYPGDVYRMQTMDGKYLYWFNYMFYVYDVDFLVPGYNGYLYKVNDSLGAAKYQAYENQLSKWVISIKHTDLPKIKKGKYDCLYEIVNMKDTAKSYYLALKNGKPTVFNFDGEIAKKYPSVINLKLLKTKINNQPSWDWYDGGAGRVYPKRVGTEEAGTIFVHVPQGQWF